MIFLQRLIARRVQKRRHLRHLWVHLLLLFAGTSASAYRVGFSKASVLVRKLAQFKCFEHEVERQKATQDLHFDVFQLKRDAIKSNVTAARLSTGIYIGELLWDFSLPLHFKTCRVTVQGHSVVLLTYSSFNGKKIPYEINLGKNRSRF